MQEFEAKFSGFSLEKARELLKMHGYQCVSPEKMMVRKCFHVKGNSNKWGRVRNEGDKITLTIKEITKDNDISGMQEAEVIIHSFEEGENVLKMCGFYEVSFQETKRELWKKNDVEVMIDTWPGLKPFVEVESKDALTVQNACTELGLDYSHAMFGGVDVVYMKELNLPASYINKLSVITFENPPKAAA